MEDGLVIKSYTNVSFQTCSTTFDHEVCTCFAYTKTRLCGKVPHNQLLTILFTEASILRLLIAKGSGMDQGYMTKLEVVLLIGFMVVYCMRRNSTS